MERIHKLNLVCLAAAFTDHKPNKNDFLIVKLTGISKKL